MRRCLQILEPGTHTTVQDLGRPGHRAAGVALCGAVDPVSMRIANLLVGNSEDAAGLECALVGPSLRFGADCRIAFAGADCSALRQGAAMPVRAKQTIHIGPLRDRAYAYLAIAGGIEVEPVLGSRSTDVRVGIGGHEGRRLRRGDVLNIGVPTATHFASPCANTRAFLPMTLPIGVLPGIDARRVDAHWPTRTFRVAARSDRMGMRLEGEPVRTDAPANEQSSTVLPGTIQLPPGGQPIVLLADAQSLGGYLQIGHVIQSDLPRLAQYRPGAEVRFEVVSVDEAHRRLRRREMKLALLRYALRGDEERS